MPNQNDRNDARAHEERARKRKQDEIAQLRGVLKNMIPPQVYGKFLEQVGDIPKYNAGQLVEWQLINISTKALKYYISLSENQKQEIAELNSKIGSLQMALKNQSNQTRSAQPQPQQSYTNQASSYGQGSGYGQNSGYGQGSGYGQSTGYGQGAGTFYYPAGYQGTQGYHY